MMPYGQCGIMHQRKGAVQLDLVLFLSFRTDLWAKQEKSGQQVSSIVVKVLVDKRWAQGTTSLNPTLVRMHKAREVYCVSFCNE